MSGNGIDLNTLNISAIFFADDIVLIGQTSAKLDRLMNITRNYFFNHKLELSLKKSKVMTHNATTGNIIFNGSSSVNPLSLEQVLSFKYLGVPINCSPYNMFKGYNEQVRKRAHSYLASVKYLGQNWA